MPVQLQAPQMSDIDSWQGAFISSTSRLVLPACEVQYEKDGQPCKKVRSPTAVQFTEGALCDDAGATLNFLPCLECSASSCQAVP